MAKDIPCQGKHREFGNFAKTQGIWFAQVLNYLILKVKDFSMFAAKISNFFLSWISRPSQFCVSKNNKSRKLAQGKSVVGQGKHREIEKCNLSGYSDCLAVLFRQSRNTSFK